MSSVREATISALEGVSLTRHVGRPTLKSVKLTRHEIAKVYAVRIHGIQSVPVTDRTDVLR